MACTARRARRWSRWPPPRRRRTGDLRQRHLVARIRRRRAVHERNDLEEECRARANGCGGDDTAPAEVTEPIVTPAVGSVVDALPGPGSCALLCLPFSFRG